MKPIVILGGTGDVYLISALFEAFWRHHARPDTELVCRQKFRPIADMFPGLPITHNEELIRHAEDTPGFQATYPNPLEGQEPFYAHPCMLRSQTRVDHLTTKYDTSQADMYRMILRVPPDTPLAIPKPPKVEQAINRVLIIRDAVSWPNTQPQFWDMLADRLRAQGREVRENDKSWPLGDLLLECAAAEWVIGPQCGVMSILCTGRFPCRKTLCTPTVDHVRSPGFLAAQTYPYGYVTKFDGQDYDIEEFKITETNHAELVEAIATGQNALRIWPNDPTPVATLMVPMSPGDALDRLAVLQVKRNRFPPKRRAAIEREYQRYSEACRKLLENHTVAGFYGQLVDHHDQAFMVLERVVPHVMYGNAEMATVQDHVLAIRQNRLRVDLRRRIDSVVHAPYREVKNYYSGEDGT